MKLLKQKKLYFSEGKSDKVYEADLCESSADLFVVNFRYGRRGANLREGTKTVFPVAYDEAVQIFDKLITSKEKKGYSESGIRNSATPLKKHESKVVNAVREETILKYLKEASLGTYTRNWKLSRIILRAAHLNITAAVPFIIHFINSEDEFEQYAAIHTLAQFKDLTAIEAIVTVFDQKGFTTKAGRIAAAYILKFGTKADQSKINAKALQEMPNELEQTISNTDTFLSTLSIYFLKETGIDASALYYTYIYAYTNENLRKQLYEFIQKIPFKTNTFKSVRYIYRVTEILNDISFSALISKRIAISKPGYTSEYMYIDGQWSTSFEEKKKPNPTIAFSGKTKNYFNRATYKLVYNLSTTNETGYVNYVTELLCALDDAIDKTQEEFEYFYTYDDGNYNSEKRYFPKYHNFLALMYVIYGSSRRLHHQKKKWYYTEVIETAALPREEALPELWNTKPQEVLYILAHAKSEEAIRFSLRIIQDNPHFLEEIAEDILGKLIQHYDARVLNVVLEVLERKYANTQPEENNMISLLSSKNEKAIEAAMGWLKKYEAAYFSSADFIAKLLLTSEEIVLTYLKELYATEAVYKTQLSIAQLDSFFKLPATYTFEYLVSVNYLIGETQFGKLLSAVSEDKIQFLAGSKSITNKLFAANLSKHNALPAYQLFKDTYDDYINSEEEILRKVGIELLAHFPDEFLIAEKQQIGVFCFSEHAEVREAIQPVIERLIDLDSDFKENLLDQLLNVMIAPETYEGVHENSYVLLTNYYGKDLPSITQEGIVGLILSRYEFAQRLGTPLFKERIVLKDFTIDQLVELASSDVLVIRESLHDYFNENTARINYELEGALRIFNSNWQDVIDWSCAFFEKEIEPENWTLDILLYISDHTKKEVQAFGRKMITTHFSEDKGLPLLLKLQEHPTRDMQFFVTNYLDNYAKDKPDVILKLEGFFKTSLFNINTNRVAKTRIYAFLEQEAIKNIKVAEMTVRLIDTVLGTKTIQDKSHNIDLLLAIKEAHPAIEVPLVIKSIS